MDATTTSDTYRFGRFRLEAHGAGLSRRADGGTWEPVTIGSRALELVLLLRRHGEILTREEVIDNVWPGAVVEESNLTVQISALRRALDPTHADPSCIQTISGRGYRFLPTVTRELAAAPIDNQGAMARATATHSRRRLSIIVVPFKSLSDDRDSALLADTITEHLTGDLARLPGTVVMAHSVIGSYSGASHLIEGSVRRSTDQARVNVELIDQASSTHLWAEWFDVDQAPAADSRDEIAGRLVRILTVKLVEDAYRRIEADPLSEWTSDDLVMRGRALASRPFSEASRSAAMCCFEQALVIEPASIGARVGIAAVLVSNILDGWSRSSEPDIVRAEQLFLGVLRDDAEVPGGRLYLGSLRRLQGRLIDARIELEIAIALAPNNPVAHNQLGAALVFLGEPGAAIRHIEKSLRLGPHDRCTPLNYYYIGLCHLVLGHTEEASSGCGRPVQAIHGCIMFI